MTQKMTTLKRTITINLRKSKNNFIVYNLMSLNMLVGSSAVGSNLQLYDVKKSNNNWYVPIRVVKKRLNDLKIRREKLNDKISIIEQILKNGR